MSEELVEGWEEDMIISNSPEYENSGNDTFYFDNETNKLPDYTFEDLNSNDIVVNKRNCNSIINFERIHVQDMNRYQESYNYPSSRGYTAPDDGLRDQYGNQSMLGPIEPREPSDSDSDFDQELNQLIQGIDEYLESDNSNDLKIKDEIEIDPKREQYEDYCDEFLPEETESDIPKWYQKILDRKIRDARVRLSDLSRLVCMISPLAREKIQRIEQDHNTPFCQLDEPRHPPFNKPWQNYWKFNCLIQCKHQLPIPEHVHSSDCETLVLQHAETGITIKSQNIFSCEFPDYVLQTVELFQKFAINISKDPYLMNSKYQKITWVSIKMRSNYKNELMLVVQGKGIGPAMDYLRQFFSSGPGRSSNVVSLYCINQKPDQKKAYNISPTFLSGCLELRDKVGTITINYTPKTSANFNSIEAQQLGKIMLEYLAPTKETTLIEAGSDFLVICLMLANKCDKVIGLRMLEHDIKMAERVKSFNNIHNATFITCPIKDILTKCSPLIQRCISVAIIDLSSHYGKSQYAWRSLRNLPSIWRIVAYGSFGKEFHKLITILTSKDDSMGEEFFPMRGCVLDKSPSQNGSFNIIVLFERKSLIEPSIGLIEAGPTVNITADINEKKFSIKKENDSFSKNPTHNLFKKTGHSTFGQFDIPSLDRNSESVLSVHSQCKGRAPYSKLDKIFDCPSLPKKREEYNEPSTSRKDQDNPPVKKERPLRKEFDFLAQPDAPPPPKRCFDQKKVGYISKKASKKYDGPSLSEIKVEQHCENEIAHPLKSIKKEKDFYSTVSTKREKRSFTPPPISLKKETESNSPSRPAAEICIDSVPIKMEPRSPTEKEEGELSPENDGYQPSCPVAIKSEPVDNEGPNLTIKSEPVSPSASSTLIPPNVVVKTEPVDVVFPMVSIKKESGLEEEQSIMNLEEFENMKTPVHVPVAHTQSISPSSPLASTNFKTEDGFEFSVKPNQSFLSFKPNSRLSKQSAAMASASSASTCPISVKQEKIHVKMEPVDNMDDEVKIIEQKQKLQKETASSKDRMKCVIKEEMDREDVDLHKLLEQKKNLQMQLDEAYDYKYSYSHSGSPLAGASKRPRSPASPDRYRTNGKPYWSPSYRRSPPPSVKPRYNRRSPSLSPEAGHSRPRYGRRSPPPSPRQRYNRRSPSPVPRYDQRSPVSPARRYGRRSPVSPAPRHNQRSPLSPPGARRNRRSPLPSGSRWNQRTPSPVSRYHRRSPVSPARRYGRRSPVSPGTRYRRSPSPYRHSSWRGSPPYVYRDSMGTLGGKNKRSPSGHGWPRASPRSPSPEKFKRQKSRSPSLKTCVKSRTRSRSPLHKAALPTSKKKKDSPDDDKKRQKKKKSIDVSPEKIVKKVKKEYTENSDRSDN